MGLKTYLIKGRAKWAKIIGKAPPGYDNGPAEWSIDILLDDQGKKDYVASGADKFYLREDKEGQTFVKFTRKAEKKDGTPSKPIEIVDHKNQAWDNRLIGNDSVVNVCFTLRPVKSKGKERLKPSILSMQIWDYLAYKPKGPFAAKADAETQDAGSASSEEWDGN